MFDDGKRDNKVTYACKMSKTGKELRSSSKITVAEISDKDQTDKLDLLIHMVREQSDIIRQQGLKIDELNLRIDKLNFMVNMCESENKSVREKLKNLPQNSMKATVKNFQVRC